MRRAEWWERLAVAAWDHELPRNQHFVRDYKYGFGKLLRVVEPEILVAELGRESLPEIVAKRLDGLDELVAPALNRLRVLEVQLPIFGRVLVEQALHVLA